MDAQVKKNKKRNQHSEELQNFVPESILGEIWYRIQGLHLTGAPIRIFKTWWDSVRAI
jgi:hypothetical protein